MYRYTSDFYISSQPHVLIEIFQKLFLYDHFEMLSNDEVDKTKFELTTPEVLIGEFRRRMILRLESGGPTFNWPSSVLTGDTVRFAFKNGKMLVDLTFFKCFWDALLRNLTKMLIGPLTDIVFDDSLVESNFKKIFCKRLHSFIKATASDEELLQL